ncbi:MAG: DUF1156 domain-containing protein [Dehalococcoidia bacterium]|nr:DUF1156 domain-containing protein [Dehalococcoidia bacterium]
MVWDFPEVNPFAGAGGDWAGIVDAATKTIAGFPASVEGKCRQLDAASAISSWGTAIISTDPPYYDNIGYADLSDFFYLWLRRMLSCVYPTLFSTLLTPKGNELIASAHRHGGSHDKARDFFEKGMGEAFSAARLVHSPQYPAIVYYAFKQTETDDSDEDDGDEGFSQSASTGWETMLEAMLRAGFAVDGTWPSRTEGGTRLIAMGTNALASSIVLSCRPRSGDAPLATRREFLRALKQELPDGLKHLKQGSIAPVDLAQAAIGPGMAVFTRYARVMEADGSPMKVRQALALINQTLDEVLAEQEGEFDADTRWALAWFEQNGMDDGAFGTAETLSKAKNTAVNALVEAGIVQARGGKVRLLRREELPADWNPTTDIRLRHWEIVQHLIRTLNQLGELSAAAMMHQLGGMAETARDLAYRLYSICERKKWADEALAYNGLVIAWPELTKLALAERSKAPERQSEMF